MKAKTSVPVPSEEDEQIAFVQWLQVNQIPHFHCPNEVGGQTRSLKVRAMKMKRMGVAKGVPDLFVFVPVYGITGDIDCYQMCAIEMKRRKGATATKEQKEWLSILAASGALSAVCKGTEEAIEYVEAIKREINGENK